jgi:hypothetical protein
MTLATTDKAVNVTYELEGTLLEACSCEVLCPCWIGEDPDHGTCDSINAYHFAAGSIRGVDVGGLSYVQVNQIPGNVLTPKSWRTVVLVSQEATDEQLGAIVDLFTGKLGGPLADLAGLLGEVVAVERAPIAHETQGGKGTLRIGDAVNAEMRPYVGADGETITTLRDSLFSTVPGSPAYVAKAESHSVSLPRYGMEWSFTGRNAIQSDWKISYAEPV